MYADQPSEEHVQPESPMNVNVDYRRQPTYRKRVPLA